MFFKLGSFLVRVGQLIMLVPVGLILWNLTNFITEGWCVPVPIEYYALGLLAGGIVSFAGYQLRLFSGDKRYRHL